ncbi:uncharacterized protein LTR77_009414 [Saxophila tyrrhenica]|uniref:p-hydroxylaminobenzoate lyase n=1 Tax=Saxophila tyrrhenica TaxID=1690608 RepID=A0AAV9NXK3_9PEZI|nr:hypothetical protein LTR77_009414 [Saxophila tyrrhenica]
MSAPPMHPNLRKLLDTAQRFFMEVEDLTPGKELEARLNNNHGPGTPLHDDMAALVRRGVKNNEGWVAADEIDGPNYRLSKISPPCAETRFFSITAVFMDSQDVYRGRYHLHPYGEINCVVPLDESAELMGMSGWQGAGWTSPAAGTHHYP